MTSKRLIGAMTLVVLGSACRETTLVPPRSLDGPTAIAVSRGDVCLTTFETEARTVDFVIEPCAAGTKGAIGLVINERSDTLALLDLSLAVPRLVDLDPSIPGPNHLGVGRLPVAVAVSPDQTAVYTLNQLGRDVSIVDLRGPEVLPERYHLEDTPIAMDVSPSSGEVVVAAGSPSQLYVFEGATVCEDRLPGDGEFRCSVEAGEDEARTLELPGTVSDFGFSPSGDEAWVIYRDLNFASVVAFGATPEGFDTPCLDGVDAKPCVTAQVPLSFGCSDGLDNDGDGLVDQQDEQCWGPRSAESSGGLGRRPIGGCANGIDDDEDGTTDRNDPECMAATGTEDVATFGATPLAACSDGVDNDGDGRIDASADPDCYGPFGRTEELIRPTGFDAVAIDSQGVFVYVVDRVGEQILVLDARRKQLVDAPASQKPATVAFDAELGIDVVPSPLAVTGTVERAVLWVDPDDDEHSIIRHDFGAWVASNDGSLQYVDTIVSFCEVRGEELATPEAFRNRELGEAEARCFEIPAVPLVDAAPRVVSADETLVEACTTAAFVECAECLVGDEPECGACDAFADTQYDLCERAFVYEDATVFFNPRFSLRDIGSDSARVLGAGTCEQPEALAEQLSEYAAANPAAPQDLKCTSLLQSQPLVPSAALVGSEDVADLEDLARAEAFRLRTLQFQLDEGLEPIVSLTPNDALAVGETVTVTFEGALPGTARADGVVATDTEDDDTVWVDVGMNSCDAGVEVGDRLVITTEPDEACDLDGLLEYEIVEVTASEVRIAAIESDALAAEVPTRSCFDTAITYEVRAANEWVVVGDVLGYLSKFESVFGECVPRFGSERIESRVAAGEVFSGPYYSFYQYPGFDPDSITPVRDTSFSFQFASGFEPLQFPTCSSLSQQCGAGVFPTDLVWVPGLENGTLLLSPDPNDNFVHVRNIDDPAAGYAVIR